MRYVLSLILLIAAPAMAQSLIAKQGADYVRLTDQPCPVAVLQVIPPGQRGYFRRALAHVSGKDYDACFAPRQDGTVFLVYADGDTGALPMEAFKEDSGV